MNPVITTCSSSTTPRHPRSLLLDVATLDYQSHTESEHRPEDKEPQKKTHLGIMIRRAGAPAAAGGDPHPELILPGVPMMIVAGWSGC